MSKRILEEYSKQYTFSRTTEKRKRSVHQDTLIQKKPRLDDVLLDVGVGPSTAAAEELTTTVAEASTAPLTTKGKNLHEYVMKWFKNTKQLVEKQIAYLPTDCEIIAERSSIKVKGLLEDKSLRKSSSSTFPQNSSRAARNNLTPTCHLSNAWTQDNTANNHQ
ncbi:hypothetical protein OUZ56_024406 [Daphnia magna]|uniref:Uncharacterized protein n=1 Tax=Daphnia magna TaxID=35525 RepID=A0ABR0B0R8_9CRUS|nr:hypothetical protein OUZ56_024406 [Daphnia magna]